MSDLDALLGVTKDATAADVSGLISSAEQKYGLPTGLLDAIINKGERSGAKAVSPKGAMGLGQLMPDTAKEMGVTDPFDPAQSIDGSAKYLAQQMVAHNNDPRLAVAAYNAGPGAVKKYGGIPPFKETQAYVKRVLGDGNMQSAQTSDLDTFLTSQQPSGGSASGAFLSSVGAPPKGAPAPTTQAPSSGQASQSFLASVGERTSQPTSDAPQSSAAFINMANATELNPDAAQQTFLGSPAQQKASRQQDYAGKLDRSPAAIGTAAQPFFTTSPKNNTSRLDPGVYYYDWDGVLHQKPGAPISAGEARFKGIEQGYIKDNEASIGNMLSVPVKAFSNTFNDIVIKKNPFLTDAQKEAELSAPNEIDKTLAGYKVDRDAFNARYGNNGWAGAGRLAGNVAFTAPLMGGAGAALEATPGMGFVAGTAGRGGNLLLRGSSLATRGALEGAGSSALLSSQTDEPIQNQLMGGALLGGALGTVIPAAGSVGKRMGSGLAEAGSRIASGFGTKAEKVLSPAQMKSAERKAVAYVNKLVEAAPEGALTNNAAEAAGKPITAAEALGRTAQTQLAAVARRSGKTGDLVESAMRQRQQSMPDRVLGDLSEVTGLHPEAISGDFLKQAADLRAAASPKYEAAYAVGSIDSDTLKKLSERPAMKAAMSRAMSIAAEEGKSPAELGFKVAKSADGDGAIEITAPSMQTWDYVKRGMDDVINSNRSPLTGKLVLDEKGRAQLGTLNALRDELTTLNPTYKEALSAGGEPLRLEEAYKNAPKLMGSGTPMSIFTDKVKALTESEKEAHLGGFVNDAYQKVAAGKLHLKDLSTPLFQQKLTMLLGEDKAAKLTANLAHEAELSRIGGRINPNANSPTMELTSAEKSQDEMFNNLTGAASKLAKGKPVEAALHAVASPFAGAFRGAQAPIDEATRNEVGKLLMLDPSELHNKLLSALSNSKGNNGGVARAITLHAIPAAVSTSNRLVGNSK